MERTLTERQLVADPRGAKTETLQSVVLVDTYAYFVQDICCCRDQQRRRDGDTLHQLFDETHVRGWVNLAEMELNRDMDIGSDKDARRGLGSQESVSDWLDSVSLAEIHKSSAD